MTDDDEDDDNNRAGVVVSNVSRSGNGGGGGGGGGNDDDDDRADTNAKGNRMNENDESRDMERLIAPADFDGPTVDRHCTDVFCFAFIILSWIAMTGIGIYAMANGNIDFLIRPLDYDGGICGTNFNDKDRVDFPYLLYTNAFAGVCVNACPNLQGVTADGLTDVRTLVTYGGIFQVGGAEIDLLSSTGNNANEMNNNSNAGSATIDVFLSMADYSSSNNSIVCTDDLCFPNNSTEESWRSRGINEGYGFAYYVATTYELLYRCYVTSDAEERIQLLTTGSNMTSSVGSELQQVGAVNDLYNFWNKLYGDLYVARYYIFGFGCGVSLIISLIYIALMRLPFLLTTVVWTSIFTTILLFFLGGYYAWSQATIWDDANPKTVDDRTINLTTGFSFAMYGIGAVLILLACCLRRAIMEAIVCVKEAGRAVNTMTIILLVPILEAFGFFLFMLPFIFYAAHLASLAEITTQNVPVGVDIPGIDDGEAPTIAFRTFEFDDFTENCAWYFLFCFFWTGNFIVAMGDLIVALAVSKWYFTKDKSTIGSWTVLGSILDVCYYHSGTAAYGALLVAIVQVIRTIIARAQKKAKETQNKVAEIVLCCCQCCFWCLECALKFINKNAFIQTAIFSTSFCKSCRQSFALIFRNAARVAAITYVSAAVLIVGKLFISSFVTVLAYYVLLESIGDELYSVAGPIVIIFLISYYVSDMFMDVLDMGISTVLHCFIADEEMFDNEEDRYTENDLKSYVDKHGREQ